MLQTSIPQRGLINLKSLPTYHSDSLAHCCWWQVDPELGSDSTTSTVGLDHFTPDNTGSGWVVLAFVGTVGLPVVDKINNKQQLVSKIVTCNIWY